jgi:hypothetical protein
VSADAPTTATPTDVQSAIDRYRDLAKYLIGVFAAIGALLIAGTQLSSIGHMSWDDDRARLIACAVSLAVALAAVAWVMRRAIDVLRPVDVSLESVLASPTLRDAIDAEPGLLAGAGDVGTLAELVGPSSPLTANQRAKWRKVVTGVLDRAGYVAMERRFERAWREMLIAAVVGAAAVAVLAWAANPDEDAGSGPTLDPVPALVEVSLTAAGRDALGDALGKTCPEPIPGFVIGGSSTAPKVVTTATAAGCKPAQFVLDAEWGHAQATKRAG